MRRPISSVHVKKPRRAAGGFTLLELLVVIAILALAASILPSMIGRGGPRIEADARAVVGALRAARSEAIRTGAPAEATFDLDRGLIRIPGRTIDLSDASALEVETAREAARAGGDPAIIFFPDGGATGGRVRLIEASPGGDRVAAEVGVRWLTGAVRRER